MERSYRPLLPSKVSSGSDARSDGHSVGSPPDTGGVEMRKKRQQTIVACESCRKRKSKCDGLRPICNACTNKSTPCTWTADPDAPPIVALKRKYDILKKESQDLRKLFEILRSGTEEEAQSALRWVRTADNLHSVLKSMGDGHPMEVDCDEQDERALKKQERVNSTSSVDFEICKTNQSHHQFGLDGFSPVPAPLPVLPTDAGTFVASPSLPPSTVLNTFTFSTRNGSIRIQDLLNDGSTVTQSATSSVHSRTDSRDSISPPSPMATSVASTNEHPVQHQNNLPGFRMYGFDQHTPG